jgi:diadenosine tetraphosphatase ApaH/serine/threonine PP2A family protein phosphatase
MSAGRRPRIVVPDGRSTIYAIGDVHGCFDLLLELEDRIVSDSRQFPDRDNVIIMLGDLIDRGPQSAQVIEHLLLDPPAGFTRYVLAGNHEEAMLSFLEDPASENLWLAIGGRETLASYGVSPIPRAPGRRERQRIAIDAAASIPEEHLRFLRQLPVAITIGDYFFVHAGIRPNIPLEEQTDGDLQGIRDAFTTSPIDHGFTVVHGHTPSLQPARYANRVALDVAPYATGQIATARIRGPEVAFIVTG